MEPLSPATLAPYLIGAGAGVGSSVPASVDEAARAFEAQFIYQMLRQMRASMSMDGEEKGYGADTLGSTVDLELATQISRNGGIGFARMMEAAIRGTSAGVRSADPAAAGVRSAVPSAEVPGAGSASYSPAAGAAVAAALDSLNLEPVHAAPHVALAHPAPHSALSHVALRTPDDPAALFNAAVTSPFGWRNDPFSGARKFHGGVDLAMAYGADVPAAEDGRVVVAESEGRYGNTVVLEHASGAQTRYAHLSEILVRPGDTVPAGYTLGRAGSSGAATGPHLHFEVTVEKRRMDPRSDEARALIQQLPGAAD
jgi:murein DD-endopeptidase MepM/ murein hydrolase activator NlpD